MENRERLTEFFRLENERDWERYAAFLAPGVTWELHGETVTVITGAADYLNRIKQAYENNTVQFVCEVLYENGDGDRLIAILRNDLGERSCDVFEFEMGRIVREYEFLLQ